MPARIWIVLLAVLLSVASVDAAEAAPIDLPVASQLCDEEVLPLIAAPPPPLAAPDRAVRAAPRNDRAPPTPTLAEIFRPPRPAFD